MHSTPYWTPHSREQLSTQSWCESHQPEDKKGLHLDTTWLTTDSEEAARSIIGQGTSATVTQASAVRQYSVACFMPRPRDSRMMFHILTWIDRFG